MTISQSHVFNKKITSKNRIALAPMTNTQSHDDGIASEEEIQWLERRAEGGFGMIITCASHVEESGKGWPGQMGIFSDNLLPQLRELAKRIAKHGALGIVQLHHGGVRSPEALTGLTPRSAVHLEKSDIYPDGATMLSDENIEALIVAFIDAAKRAKTAGFAGIELHGAHGYLLAQFFDRHLNVRSDKWGGSFENRIRIFQKIIVGIRQSCGEDFILAVRISPENYGTKLAYPLQESLDFIDVLVDLGVDIIHASLWDSFKFPDDALFTGNGTLLEIISRHLNGRKPLMVAGKIWSIDDGKQALAHGADFIALGKVAIGNPDWPLALEDCSQTMEGLPFKESKLRDLGLSGKFIEYLRRWPNFLAK